MTQVVEDKVTVTELEDLTGEEAECQLQFNGCEKGVEWYLDFTDAGGCHIEAATCTPCKEFIETMARKWSAGLCGICGKPFTITYRKI